MKLVVAVGLEAGSPDDPIPVVADAGHAQVAAGLVAAVVAVLEPETAVYVQLGLGYDTSGHAV